MLSKPDRERRITLLVDPRWLAEQLTIRANDAASVGSSEGLANAKGLNDLAEHIRMIGANADEEVYDPRLVAKVRDICTDSFEGLPCGFPHCSCSEKCHVNMEAEARRELGPEPPSGGTPSRSGSKMADHIDGYDRDDLGESPDF